MKQNKLIKGYIKKKKGQNIKSQFKTSIDRNILKAWSNNV